MDSSTPARPGTGRAYSWPTPDSSQARHTSKASQSIKLLQDDFDEHPDEDFLSPVDMYNEWESDSDDDADDEEVEWNAGITDFALFDEERRRAERSGQAIPEKWSAMLSSQASALNRAVERRRHDPELSISPSNDSIPDLTPDASPQLVDDLESSRPVVPGYLRSVTSSPSIPTLFHTTNDDDKSSLSFFVQPRRTRSAPQVQTLQKPARPGLRDGRTMSGKQHVWQRPSYDIYTVREDAVAEQKAEAGNLSS